jgi:hypothetical protein
MDLIVNLAILRLCAKQRYLQVGSDNYENDAAQSKTVDDGCHFVALPVRRQVLQNQYFHRLALEEQQTEDDHLLDQSLQVERNQGQSQNHAQQDHEKYLQQQAKVQCQHRQWQEKVNRDPR